MIAFMIFFRWVITTIVCISLQYCATADASCYNLREVRNIASGGSFKEYTAEICSSGTDRYTLKMKESNASTSKTPLESEFHRSELYITYFRADKNPVPNDSDDEDDNKVAYKTRAILGIRLKAGLDYKLRGTFETLKEAREFYGEMYKDRFGRLQLIASANVMNLQESIHSKHEEIVKKPNVYVENIPNDSNVVHILSNNADPASPVHPALALLDHTFTVSVPYNDFVVIHLNPDTEYHVFGFTTSAQADEFSTALAQFSSNKQAIPFPYNVKKMIE